MSDDAPLDDSVLSALERDLGAEDLAELLGTFIADIHDQLAILWAALDSGDSDVARRAAHTMKSTSATVGAQSLADLCRELEAMATAGNLSEMSSRRGQLEAEVERVVQAITARK